MAANITIVIPTLNADANLQDLLVQIGSNYKVIVSDGGSQDGTLSIATQRGAVLALGSMGRGWQLSRGARWAAYQDTDWLLFLHADIRMSDDWRAAVDRHIKTQPETAACFRFRAQANGFWPRWLSFWTNVRTGLFNLPYGDQGLLISKALYDQIGGYPDWVLFEDVAIIRAIKRTAKLRQLPCDIHINPAKYESGGYIRKPLKNLFLLVRFLAGAKPDDLAKAYAK